MGVASARPPAESSPGTAEVKEHRYEGSANSVTMPGLVDSSAYSATAVLPADVSGARL